MGQSNSQQEPIQLELLRKSLHGWEPAFQVVGGSDWTTEQLESRFGIPRQELYRIKSKPYQWRSSIFVFLHLRKNKWLVYNLKPFRRGE
jgi:hypothetical protein